mgnify:CR=1 FL=1
MRFARLVGHLWITAALAVGVLWLGSQSTAHAATLTPAQPTQIYNLTSVQLSQHFAELDARRQSASRVANLEQLWTVGLFLLALTGLGAVVVTAIEPVRD